MCNEWNYHIIHYASYFAWHSAYYSLSITLKAKATFSLLLTPGSLYCMSTQWQLKYLAKDPLAHSYSLSKTKSNRLKRSCSPLCYTLWLSPDLSPLRFRKSSVYLSKPSDYVKPQLVTTSTFLGCGSLLPLAETFCIYISVYFDSSKSTHRNYHYITLEFELAITRIWKYTSAETTAEFIFRLMIAWYCNVGFPKAQMWVRCPF